MSSTSSSPGAGRAAALVLAALLLTTLGVGTVEAPPASAGGAAKVTATIKLSSGSSRLLGTVRSARKPCRKDRTVKLFWRSVGAKGFVRVAKDTSGNAGAWAIHAPGDTIPPGSYYVTLAKHRGCRSARSATLRVG